MDKTHTTASDYSSTHSRLICSEDDGSPCLADDGAGLKNHSPSLIAKVGFELEVSGVAILPFVPKCTVLIEGNGWNLEADVVPPHNVSDLEFVLSPMSDMEDIDRAMNEIVDLAQKIRDMALLSPNFSVSFAELNDCEHSPYFVRPELLGHRMAVRDFHFIARIQATYGVSLKNMATYIISTSSEKAAEKLKNHMKLTTNLYFRRYGVNLSPASEGIMALINFYLVCTARSFDKYSTVHIFFRMLARSDFCAIYDKLLSDADKEQVKNLLIPQEGNNRPALMEALSLGADALVFKNTYLDEKYQPVPGPTVKDWLLSIVHGRNAGAYKKDLMSPPPGYRLHTGNLDKDYGMGAMGVDEINQLALFEIRAGSFRPKTDIPMNAQIKHAVFREFLDAQEQNPILREFECNWFLEVEKSYWAFNFYEIAFRKLKLIGSMIKKYFRDHTEETFQRIASEGIPAYRLSLEKRKLYFMEEGGAPCLSRVEACLTKAHSCLENLDVMDRENFEMTLSPFVAALVEFERTLWDEENEVPALLKRSGSIQSSQAA